MDRISPVLFLDDDGGPLEFAVRGLSSEYSLIVLMIKTGGGIVHVKRDGPHTIVLDKPESRIFGKDEYFSCNYIADCSEGNCLLDLNKYRLNKNSKYVKDYDANLIMLKIKSWKDIPLESEANSSSTDEDPDIEFLHSSRSLKTIARPYSESERIQIINWLIKNKSYSSVGGNVVWQMMESEKICEGRSWQSMKEHFRKKILPTIHTFGLSEKHVKCFKKRLAFIN